MKIFLVGMPGSGKTTLGKKVAAHLQAEFVDLDAEIEKREQKAIPEIFSAQGEDYFRRVESELLHEWAASSKSFVMATGGGAPCFYNGMDVINQSGISIFLDVSLEDLYERVRHKKNRPLLQTEDADTVRSRLQALRDARHAIYSQAHHTLKRATLNSILEALRIKK